MQLPWLVPLLCLAPYLLAWRVRERLLIGKYRAAGVTDRMLEWSPMFLQVIAVTSLGWCESVEGWWGVEVGLTQWPGLGLPLGILPYLVYQLCAIDARVRSSDPRRDRRRELRMFQLRLFLSALLPFALFLGTSSVVALDETWQVSIEEVSFYNTIFVGAMIAFFVLFIPFLLEKTWDTVPIEPGWMRRSLEELARAARFRCRELLVWRTGNNMANAAIIGFTPRSRVVLFSDALLAQLGPRELMAVFGHEIGHARGRHPIIFAGFALILFLGSDLALLHLPIESEAVGIGIFLGLFGLWLVAFGFVSRRFELEADLVSMELLGDERPLLEALDRIGGNVRPHKSTWRHFGMNRRAEFLGRAAMDPAVGRGLRRVLRRWTAGGALALLVILVGQGWSLRGSFDGDRVRTDLRLGRYGGAAARIEAGAEVEEEIARLVERGVELGPGPWTAAALEERARAAVAVGDLRRGRDRVDLALLRGGRDLEGVRVAFGIVLGEEEGAEPRPLTPRERGALPAPWGALLGAVDLPRAR